MITRENGHPVSLGGKSLFPNKTKPQETGDIPYQYSTLFSLLSFKVQKCIPKKPYSEENGGFRVLAQKYKQQVSLPTIIDRAKRNDFYLPKKQKKTIHDREVLTHYIGELIQHDSSYHLWSPAAQEKWHLITSLDDFSRYILYAALVKKETSWAHISALQAVILKYGCPLTYYVDSHSIFRFVQGRDSLWRNHYKLTDEAPPADLGDVGVKLT